MRRRTPVAAGGEDKLAEPGALALENVFFLFKEKNRYWTVLRETDMHFLCCMTLLSLLQGTASVLYPIIFFHCPTAYANDRYPTAIFAFYNYHQYNFSPIVRTPGLKPSLLASKRAQRDSVRRAWLKSTRFMRFKKPEFKWKISTAMIHELED